MLLLVVFDCGDAAADSGGMVASLSVYSLRKA